MNMLLRKLVSRVYREEEDGTGSSGGGGAPASDGSEKASPSDWEDMSGDVAPGADDNGEEEEGSPSDTDPEESESTPETSTPEDEAPAEKPEAEEAPDPADLPKPLTPEEQAAQAEKLQKDFDEWRKAELAKLEKQYSFDEDTAARLQTEPELVLPKLAAELELNATRRALEAVQRMIPQLVPQVVDSRQSEQKATEFFYGKNPDLKKHHKAVLEAGTMFRRLNPKATPEEAAEKIGKIVRQGLGLPEPATAGGKPAEKPSGKPAPHRPANAGAARPAGTGTKQEKSMWEELAADDD